MKLDLDPRVQCIYQQLIDAHYEAYFVGGCVRDALMGKCPHDYDVTTNADPQAVMACFGQGDFKVIPTGLKHGTVTVIHDHCAIEITTYRSDGIYEDHRSPKQVVFASSLSEDLKRRDFTINALAYSTQTGLIDEHGGIDDLRQGLIRCVGDPATRFNEDALRILRCLRFAHRLDFQIEAETLKAAMALFDTLNYVSIERITSEVFAMLTDNRKGLLRFMKDHRLLAWLFPQYPLDEQVLTKVEKALNRCMNVLELKLTLLLWPLKEQAGEILRKWKVNNELRNQVLAYLNALTDSLPTHRIEMRKLLYRHQNQVEFVKRLFHLKEVLDEITCDQERKLLAKLVETKSLFERNNLAVNGHDAMMCGFQGKVIGEVLDRLVVLILEEKTVNERETLLSLLRTMRAD